jgi:hypothetical protein
MMSSFVQIAALVILVSYCVMVVTPFAGIVIWGLVIATALYPAAPLAQCQAQRQREALRNAADPRGAGAGHPARRHAHQVQYHIDCFPRIGPQGRHTVGADALGARSPNCPWSANSSTPAWKRPPPISRPLSATSRPSSRKRQHSWLLGKSAGMGLSLLQFAASLIIAGFALLQAGQRLPPQLRDRRAASARNADSS